MSHSLFPKKKRMFLLSFKREEKKIKLTSDSGYWFCKYFFFCYIQYNTSSKSIDCRVPFLYIIFLSLHIYGCNHSFFPPFISAWESFLQFLLCGNRLWCLLWVSQLADICCDWLRPDEACILVFIPPSLQVCTFLLFTPQIKNSNKIKNAGSLLERGFPYSFCHCSSSYRGTRALKRAEGKGTSMQSSSVYVSVWGMQAVTAHPLLWGRWWLYHRRIL